MEQIPVSINPDSLKRFTKHLCLIAKKHSDREKAHQEMTDQLSRIKTISTHNKLAKTTLKNEIKKLESKIEVVLQKEAELHKAGKIDRMMISLLKAKIEELEQGKANARNKRDSELSSINRALASLQKRQNRALNSKRLNEVKSKPLSEDIKDQIRKRMQELESRYALMQGKYSPEQLTSIGSRISNLKKML